MTETYRFDPDWTIHPGATLADWMAEREVDRIALADRMCAAVSVVDGVLDGSVEIDNDIARALAQATAIPAKFWLDYQAQHLQRLAEGKTWVK